MHSITYYTLLIFYKICQSIENFFYRKDKDFSLTALENARQNVANCRDMEAWHRSTGFVYQPDHKFLDYGRSPWVTYLKKHGDCDDMMLLNEYILKGKYRNIMKAFVYSKTAGHAILLLSRGDVWYVMSNTYCTGPYTSKENAIKSIFGDNTIAYFIFERGA